MEMLRLPARKESWPGARRLPEGCVAETSQDQTKSYSGRLPGFSRKTDRVSGTCLGKSPLESAAPAGKTDLQSP